MLTAINAAQTPPADPERLRIVCFMTDGYVGNDMEIIGEVQKHANARVFSFGIGSSVNRFLLDKMAEAGRGEVEYVGLEDDGSAAAKRFHERVRSPLLTDITVDWAGLPVSEIYPKRVPDLFSAKPVVLNGRYSAPAKGTIRLRGRIAGKPFVREIAMSLPAAETHHDVLATLWARRKVDDLMAQDWAGMQHGSPNAELREAITQLGLDYRLMTQFTSFVAVEDTVITEGGRPKRVEVPVEMPHGVSYEGVFGERREMAKSMAMNAPASFAAGGMWRRAAPPPAARSSTVVAEADQILKPQVVRKLDPKLAALVGKQTGKVDVQIWVSNSSQATLDKLKALGVEVVAVPPSGRLVLAKVPVEKLEEVAKLEVVRYISPRS